MLMRYSIVLFLAFSLMGSGLYAQISPSDISVQLDVQEFGASERPGATLVAADAGFMTGNRYAFVFENIRLSFKKKVFVHFSFRDKRTNQTLLVDGLTLKSANANDPAYHVRHWFGTYYILDNSVKQKLEDQLEFNFTFNGNQYTGFIHIYWRWFADQPVTERVTSAPTSYDQPAATTYSAPTVERTNVSPGTQGDLIARSIAGPVQSYEAVPTNDAVRTAAAFNPGNGYSLQIAAWEEFPDLGQYDLPANWPLYGKQVGKYYKVLIGPFPNRASAQAMLPSVKAAGHKSAWMVSEDGNAEYYWEQVTAVPQLQARSPQAYEYTAPAAQQARTPTAYDGGVVYRPEYQAPAQPESRRTYTVQRGDTFFSIAKQYNITVDELQRLNPQVNPRLIRPNQPLYIE